MGGFDAGQQVERLNYDFSTLTDPDGKPYSDAKGIIPEPSSGEVQDLLEKLIAAGKDAGLDAEDLTGTPQQVALALAGADREQLDRMKDALLDAIGEFTKGHPTRDEIAALPHRLQDAFIGWLLGEFTDPFDSPTGTRDSAAAPAAG